MIYPNNFESKIGFDEIRGLLKQRCLSNLGKEMVDKIAYSNDRDIINEWLLQVREFRQIQSLLFPSVQCGRRSMMRGLGRGGHQLR